MHAKLHLVDLQIILVVLVQVWLADCLEILRARLDLLYTYLRAWK